MPLAPSDARECADALRDCAAAGRSLRIRGSGTKDALGDLLPTDDVVHTRALTGVVDHVPADLTATVRAGTRLRDLQAALGERGQFLPLDPPHREATIGGIVCANSNGLGSLRYGTVRDLLIGSTTALADGTIARAGGRVVKNVAGYDLNKLLVGSLGTLGVVVECTFKVLPRPAVTAGAHAEFARGADAFAAADSIVRTPARPASLAISSRAGAHWELALQADGDAAPVERTLEMLAQSARAHGGSSQRRDDVAAVLVALNEISGRASGTVVRAALPLAAQSAFAAT